MPFEMVTKKKTFILGDTNTRVTVIDRAEYNGPVIRGLGQVDPEVSVRTNLIY